MKRRELPTAKVAMPTPCIEGLTSDPRGYVAFGKNRYGHRIAYEQAVGPIPVGFDIDHLCRNRACVNPAHLEAVPHAENIRRAMRLVSECAKGHPYNEANTYIGKQGWRGCRVCHRLSERRRREARRLQAVNARDAA